MKRISSCLSVALTCAIWVLCCVAVTGCSSDGAKARGAAPVMMSTHAECLVCKKNADLACVDIPVDETTPSCAYEGKTYYFCSDECRNEFAKHPSKYVR
jgi:YHS domain-containing protein